MPAVYLDNNATTPVLPEIVEAMQPFFSAQFGNASSIHRRGQQARAAVERAREQVALLVGARPAEIVFTSGGTEGDNLALFGLLAQLKSAETDHIITSTIEHHAVLNAAERLRELGVEVTFVGVDSECRVDPGDVRRALRPNTRLISVMAANNETGVLQPLREIGRIAAEADVWFHTDAVQAAGKMRLNVDEIGCDLLTISGHKMHAPQGIGALYVRRNTLLSPLLWGGRHERGRRAGTENVPAIVALGKAAAVASEWLEAGGPEQMSAARDRLENALVSEIEAAQVNGGGAPRVPNTTNISFAAVEGEALVIALDLKGLAVSTGAACSSGAIEPSHVLTAMGLAAGRARGSLRFSLGKQTTAPDIDYAILLVPETVARLRELSPMWKPRPAAV
ncbi:MAG: cysteine desulfurase [Acidobacteria bacterium]|nr:cysteine desulfurase [Acidobacteriota bacterium]